MLYIKYLQESLERITNIKLFGQILGEEHTSNKQQLLS